MRTSMTPSVSGTRNCGSQKAATIAAVSAIDLMDNEEDGDGIGGDARRQSRLNDLKAHQNIAGSNKSINCRDSSSTKSIKEAKLIDVSHASIVTSSSRQAASKATDTLADTDTRSSRLVFGLSSRTNRAKHDEYAQNRAQKTGQRVKQPAEARRRQQQQQSRSVTSINDSSIATKIVGTNDNQSFSERLHRGACTTMNNEHYDTSAGSANEISKKKYQDEGKQGHDKQSMTASAEVAKEPTTANTMVKQLTSVSSVGAPIRASKHGNFYRPQDIVTGSEQNFGSKETTKQSDKTKLITSEPNETMGLASNIADEQQQQQNVRKSRTPKREKKSASPSSSPSPSPSRRHNKSTGSPSPSRRGSSSSPSRRKSRTGEPYKEVPVGNDKIGPTNEPPPRMQFNIPPPRQQQVGVTGKPGGSVVSYAKSRIYDRPTAAAAAAAASKQQQQLLVGTALGVRATSGAGGVLQEPIPASILSGVKPPKQVNVSKAREKWEGGEPFAKCKSRQRLAAQHAASGKKLLHGIWSMTSVVATQQLQLQQALSQSAMGIRSDPLKLDPSVKILTRGSVLERVQQFERAPPDSQTGSGRSSADSSPPDSSSEGWSPPELSPSSSAGSLSGAEQQELLARTGSGASLASAIEATLTIGEPMPVDERSGSPTINSKQAQYKNRVSSIQSSGVATNPLALTLVGGSFSSLGDAVVASSASGNGSPLSSSMSPMSPRTTGANGQRLTFNLSRRSSTTRKNSTSQCIPKFYHPHGKPPNTYEIELQKKNIVDCFDKFPERKASLVMPTHKRHFQAIARACGFSDYFKSPLYNYVKYQMSESNILHNSSATNTTSILSRKQSGIGLTMMNANNTGSSAQKQPNNNDRMITSTVPANSSSSKSLSKAASIDTSTMEKIQSQPYITCEQFLVCWRNLISKSYDNAARFVHLLTLGKRDYLLPDDFVPLIQSIIDDHPGLTFLRAAPDFHMRYVQTVIARIYFCINKSWTGKITINELRHSNFLAVLQVLGQEDDINQITDYFSYEHFYVIYCKFWNLDQDHDLLISKEDLAKHNDAAISSRIIDKIFMGIVSRQILETGMMSYFDFVWFLIAEEDKKHPRSIEYWFRLMDIDGDGYISMYEMEYFYYEQVKRLELMNIEALPFNDCACQILDLVNPREKNKVSLSDLKRTKMATIFFDTFINLEKYLEHESREFVSTRDIIQDGVVISDWDRYASEEYENLVSEETKV